MGFEWEKMAIEKFVLIINYEKLLFFTALITT